MCSSPQIVSPSNTLNAELYPICHLRSLLGAQHIPHVSSTLRDPIRTVYTSYYRGADKSLARLGRKQARKHVRDMRDFNNIETPAAIKFFSMQSKAPKEIHAILKEALACFLPGRAKDLSAPLYSLHFKCHDIPAFHDIINQRHRKDRTHYMTSHSVGSTLVFLNFRNRKL